MMMKSMHSTANHAQTINVSMRHFAKEPKVNKKVERLLKKYPDPSAPARPANAFIRFGADYRKNIQNEWEKSSTMIENSKRIGAAWRMMDEPRKARYTEASAKDSQQYEVAKKQYEESGKDAAWLDKIIKASKTKPPTSGYQYFIKICMPKVKASNPSASHKEIFLVELIYLAIFHSHYSMFSCTRYFNR